MPNRAPGTFGVNPAVSRWMQRLLSLPPACQSVFWVSVLSGAASENGWCPSDGERRDAFTEWRGKTVLPKTYQRAMDDLVDAELLRCEIERAAVRVTVADVDFAFSIRRFLTTNPGCKNDDQTRDESRENTDIDRESNLFLDLDRDTERERKLEQKKEKESAGAPVGEQIGIPGVEVGGKAKPVSPRKLTEKLVELWAKRSGRPRVRVLERRVRMVKMRLSEGYEPDDLFKSIAGVCYSPFHREGGYDTFEVALRNGEQVEKGRRLWMRHAPIEVVEEHQRRTGERVDGRADELARRERVKSARDDYDDRLTRAADAYREAQQAREDEARRDEEATELAMAAMVEEA